MLCFSVNSIAQTNNEQLDIITELVNANTFSNALKAINLLEKIDEKERTTATYWQLLAKACETAHRYEAANENYNKAIAIAPNNDALYYEKAIFLNTNNYLLDSAVVALNKAIAIQTKGEYYFWRAIIYQRLLQRDKAIGDYEKALHLGAKYPELYTNLGILYVEQQNLENGLKYLNLAIASDSTYPAAYSARSKVYLTLNMVNEACKDNDRVVQLRDKRHSLIPDSVCNGSPITQTRFAAGVCALLNQYNQSIKLYSRVINEQRGISDDYLNRGFCYFQLNENRKAEADYLKALSLPNPALDQICDNLSLLYYKEKKMPQSIEYSSKRIELDPNNVVAYIDRGTAKRALKLYKEAEADFDKALQLNPRFFRAYGYRAFLFLELGDYQKAMIDASKALEINKEYGYAFLVLGQIKIKMGIGDYCEDFRLALKYGEEDAAQALKSYCPH